MGYEKIFNNNILCGEISNLIKFTRYFFQIT